MRPLLGCLLAGLATGPAVSDIPTKLPSPPKPPAMSSSLRRLTAVPEGRRQAATWRRIADTAASERQYTLARKAYIAEAAIYRRNGDVQGALVEEAKAARYTVEVVPYVREAPTQHDLRRLHTRGRLEPSLGAYLGAFVEHDDTAQATAARSGRSSSLYDAFAGLAGEHVSHFTYLTYGNAFPRAFCQALKRDNRIPHIAWEPRSLADVFRSPDYLRDFALEVARFDHPIFLRFAGEMNGQWTRYHGNPAEYRRAFRHVASVIHGIAPRAAMLWCPNAIPLDQVDAYYPGDDVVDWVGINLYSVMFYDNDRTRPAHDDPVDLIRPIYARYASRKPIAIGEWGASHYSTVERVQRPELAIRKIARLYGALPRLFPRLKLMDYYDCNNIAHARAGRQLNDYSLTSSQAILEAYRSATDDPWFLRRPDSVSSVVYRKLAGGYIVRGSVKLSAWVKTPSPSERVYWSIDGNVRYATAQPGPAAWTWETSRETPGRHRVSILVYDNRGRFLGAQDTSVEVRR